MQSNYHPIIMVLDKSILQPSKESKREIKTTWTFSGLVGAKGENSLVS